MRIEWVTVDLDTVVQAAVDFIIGMAFMLMVLCGLPIIAAVMG